MRFRKQIKRYRKSTAKLICPRNIMVVPNAVTTTKDTPMVGPQVTVMVAMVVEAIGATHVADATTGEEDIATSQL